MANVDSMVEYFGAQEEQRCGYCKSGDEKRFTHSLWAHRMTVQVYQHMLDRGWRRSGKYCYKPTMDKICCPQYTIRCHALDFHPSKSQKRAVRRLIAFLNSGVMPKSSVYIMDDDHQRKASDAKPAAVPDSKVERTVAARENSRIEPIRAVSDKESTKPKDEDRRQRKAKFRRWQRKLEKLRARGISVDALPPRPRPMPKRLEDVLAFAPSSTTKCLKVVGGAHTLEIRLVRSSPASKEFSDTFKKSAAVYLRYQDVIHRDPSSEHGFNQFLVNSPLKTDFDNANTDHPGYGSFHQQYWLDDDKLIAVGVLDILPTCVSSKYLYYDPEYRPLAVGIYSALVEIALVRQLQQHSPNLRYYYMGFYIHTCPKMRYKGRYRPSDLLCPETYTWHPLDHCQKKLDASSYSRFDDTGAGDPDGEVDLDSVSVLFDRTLMPYPVYKRLKYNNARSEETDEEEVVEYARLLGQKAVSATMLYRSPND